MCLQYPPGYLEAMANKTKKEASVKSGGTSRGKRHGGRGRPRIHPKAKEEEEDEDEEEEPLMSTEDEEMPQSNGRQKTAKESGGCFYSRGSKVREVLVLRFCEKRTDKRRVRCVISFTDLGG